MLKKLLLLFTVLVLSACGPSSTELMQQQLNQGALNAKTALGKLDQAMRSNTLNHGLIIAQYSKKLAKLNPDLKEVASTLGLEATTQGASYKYLQTRYSDAKTAMTANQQTLAVQLAEFNAIKTAASPMVFNDSLIDVINTLSDLSAGKLPRLNIERLAKDSAGAEYGAGSHMIGNPSYGQWRTDSSGMSVWAWYGAYRMMGDVLGGYGNRGYRGGSIYRSSYERNRGWNYYSDYGRDYYGSSRDRSSHQSTMGKMSSVDKAKIKPKKVFNKPATAKRASTYAQSNKSNGSSAKKASSYGSKTNTSSSTKSKNSSFRSSSSKSSGSSRGGK